MAGTIVQECGTGLVELRRAEDVLSFAAPPPVRTGPIEDDHLERIVAAYGIAREQVIGHQWVDNGPGWAVVQMASAQEVLDLDPDFSDLPNAMVGAVGAHPAGADHAFELSSFAPGVNVFEDPVCGSMNASVAQWLTSTGQAPEHYTVSQGSLLGRAGRIEITVEGGTVWVGGATAILFRGDAQA